MPDLFSKDEDILKSAPIVGFEILKLISSKEDSRISIFDVARKFKEKYRSNARAIYYGMIFLYAIDVIEFDAPYLVAKC